MVFVVGEVGLFHVEELWHEVMELSEALLGDAEVCVLVVYDLVNVGQASSEVQIILGALGSFESDIVELEVSAIDGGWFQDQAVTVFVLFGNVQDFFW